MDRLGVDLFHWAGKMYVAMVDYFSGYKWMDILKRLNTEEVIKTMTRWFNSGSGIPRVVRADAGPQFRHSFNNWLDSLGIIRETSSAYNPESNGMVEKAVGDIKRVLKKLSGKEDLLQTTSDMNNSVRTDCDATLAELMAGRPIKTSMIGSSRREVDLAMAYKKRMEAQRTALQVRKRKEEQRFF